MKNGVRQWTGGMPRNSVALLTVDISTGAPMGALTHFIAPPSPTNPVHVGFWSPPEPDQWYWPTVGLNFGDGFAHVISMRMENAGSGLFPFATAGMDVLSLPLVSLGPDPLTWAAPTPSTLPHVNSTWVLGCAAGYADGFIYILGSNNGTAMMARVPAGSFTRHLWGDLVYYVGDGAWAPFGAAPPAPLFPFAPSETTLFYSTALSAWYILRANTFLSDSVELLSAPRPEGPWSPPVPIYRIPQELLDGAFCYAGKAHPELSPPGASEFVWSFVCNTPRIENLLNRTDVYVPRLIRTTIGAAAATGSAVGGVGVGGEGERGARGAPQQAPATVAVDARVALARTDATRFASFSFDFTALWGVQRTAIPFADARLRQYARNLAPAYVRFGGSLQDRAISTFAGVPQPPAPPPTMLALALNESVFDGLVDFADATGLDLVYGLNAAVGRQTAGGGTAPWDAENALAPVVRAAARGFRLPVVELGNEVNVFNCSKDGAAKMSPAQLAAQYAVAAAAVRSLLPGTRIWGSDSSITGDVAGQCHDWYGDDIFGFNRDLFAQPGWADVLDGYSWHYYSQDSRNATSTASLILSDEYQTRLLDADEKARAVRDAAAPGLPILLGETASFWAGGRGNVSNRFASGFFYLPQLAALAARGYLTHIRQDLAGGDYGMLDLLLDDAGAVVDFSPNPDYFLHALWQRLVAGTALLANVSAPADAPRVRAWAACAARAAGGARGGVTVVFANFDTAPAPIVLALVGGAPLGGDRHEYVLTAGDGAGLASKVLALNGAALAMSEHLSLPAFPPAVAPASAPLVLPPLSYGFLVLPEAGAPACTSEE